VDRPVVLPLGYSYWCLIPLSTTFQLYIVEVSFICYGNQST